MVKLADPTTVEGDESARNIPIAGFHLANVWCVELSTTAFSVIDEVAVVNIVAVYMAMIWVLVNALLNASTSSSAPTHDRARRTGSLDPVHPDEAALADITCTPFLNIVRVAPLYVTT